MDSAFPPSPSQYSFPHEIPVLFPVTSGRSGHTSPLPPSFKEMSSTSTEDEIRGIEIRGETWTKFYSEIIDNYLTTVKKKFSSVGIMYSEMANFSRERLLFGRHLLTS